MFDDLLSAENLKQAMGYPLIELKEELECVLFKNKHPVRSRIRAFCILVTIAAGFLAVWQNPEILKFFMGVIKSLEFIPEALHVTAAYSLATLISSSIGAYTSKVVIRSFCKFRYGDPDFYLTPKKIEELTASFKEQEVDIEPKEIQTIVNFCIQNLRNSHSAEIGAKPQDWEQILEDLIYGHSVESLIEQQEALKAKHELIKEKIDVLATYAPQKVNSAAILKPHCQQPMLDEAMPGELNKLENTERLSQVNLLERLDLCTSTPKKTRARSASHKSTSSNYVTSTAATETTPLLFSHAPLQPRRLSSTLSQVASCQSVSRASSESMSAEDALIAKQVIAKMKHHLKTHKGLHMQVELSEEHVWHTCSQHLAKRSYHTSSHICPLKATVAPRRNSGGMTVITPPTSSPITPNPGNMGTLYLPSDNIINRVTSEEVPDIEFEEPSPPPSMHQKRNFNFKPE